MRQLVLFLLLASCPLSALRASDEIRCMLALATNETPPVAPPTPLKDHSSTIKRVFGYNSLYLLGQKKRAITGGSTEWLVPDKELYLRVNFLEQEPSHYRVCLELFRDKEPLLTSEARLALASPLYIRGPQWGRGQLILILEVR